MKKRRALVLGIVSGLLCAFSVFLFMQEVRGEAEAARTEALSRYGGEQLEVCVAVRNIAPGEKIDASNATTKSWVADLLPEGAVRALSEVSDMQVTSAILAGEVVSLRRFEGSDAALEIPKGLSALSVPAKDVQTVGGSLVAGMRVDVYVTGVSTDLLARNTLVIATNVESAEAKANASTAWVTLALEPESVQEIITASQNKELYFVLPSPAEKGES